MMPGNLSSLTLQCSKKLLLFMSHCYRAQFKFHCLSVWKQDCPSYWKEKSEQVTA